MGQRPLHGLLVLDFSTLLPGPLATLMLAEAGAEVVKIEKPGGEDMRRFPPRLGDTSAPYAMLNRGKRVLELDLKDEGAREVLDPLLARADILVEQFRPGVMDRLGLGYEALAARHPRLIYCSITGYGQAGPRAQEPGHDLNYLARSGLLSLSPGSVDAPTVPPALIADIAGGAMPAVMNILLALRQREATGRGCRLDVAMADAMFTFAWYALAEGFATGRMPGSAENRLAGGSPRYALYPTADGRFVAVGALEEKFWQRFCEVIDLPGSLRDDEADPAATRAAVADRLRAATGETWRKRLDGAECCATVVASLEEALADPHFRSRDLFARSVPAGDVDLPALALPIDRQFRD
jgi:crotonobetainyl-CoA:carnitine CoA-transferase CaiB-like acyl-CoA transferase